MCGIAGLLDPDLSGGEDALGQRGEAMARALAYRGPDESAIWSEATVGLVLTHRRLSIVDLSPAGSQPMVSSDGRHVLVYNGELYNTEEMRAHPALRGVAWRGHSDTEVLLESIARRGLETALGDANGMFALSVFDRFDRTLALARDRMGIKPLFWFHDGQRFAFASELKALVAAGLDLAIDPRSVASYLRLAYVPGEHAIYQNVSKVAPGEILTFRLGSDPARSRFWNLRDVAAAGLEKTGELTDEQAIERLDELLLDAVRRQMVADVDLGAFLSGGIDSSTIAAMMVRAGQGRVRTFSIGFTDFGWNEAPYANAVANHLGTDHTELMLTANDALATVPNLADIYDEPFGDSSQIPTLLVSKLARQSVTVALSGDGGDELFAGYNRHLFAHTRWPYIRRVPLAIRRDLAGALDRVPVKLLKALERPLLAAGAPPQAADKLKKIASILALDDSTIHARLASIINTPEHYCAVEEYTPFQQAPDEFPLLHAMRLNDMVSYLPGDILQKVDRASMAVSLEARPPMLDHRIVEMAWQLPTHQLIRDGVTKWLLRQVLYRHVPKTLLQRPKMGFGVPLADWLRGPLREWASDLLLSADFAGGFVDREAAQRAMDAHLDGRANNAYALWNLLMFESWRRRWT